MKSFRVNLEDRLQFGRTSSKSIGCGRLKKGALRKKIGNLGFRELDSGFYLKVASLNKNEIGNFIREFQITIPTIIKGTNYAVEGDIIAFQKELKSIIKNIKIFKATRKNKIAYTEHHIHKITEGLSFTINKYLKDCYLEIGFPPIIPFISQQPLKNDLKSYHEEVKNFTPESNGLLKANFFIKNGRGENFTNLVCHCNSLLSWCVLDMVIDLLIRNELIRVCQNCNRFFKAKEQRQIFCIEKVCQVDRNRKIKAKSRKLRR